MSAKELITSFEMLDEWCRSKPEMVVDEHRQPSLRDGFPTPNAFVTADQDELDAALVDEGWRSVTLTEVGVSYEADFTPILDLIMKLAAQDGVEIWSGRAGPAPPTDRRQKYHGRGRTPNM